MYYKYIKDDCIVGIGTGAGKGVAIAEEEYNKIQKIIDNRPAAPEGYYYILNNKLEWELKEKIKIEDGEVINEL